MLRNLAIDIVNYEGITTTEAKARDVRSIVEKLITLGKKSEDLHARRQAIQLVRNEKAVKKVFEDLGPRYSDRDGGYTRILKLGYRRGDSAPIARIELVE